VATDQNWIADLLAGYKQILDSSGNQITPRNILQIIGATFADNPNYQDPTTEAVVGSTVMTVAGGAGSGGQSSTVVANGLNSNVATAGNETLRLTGPTTAFSVGGFAPQAPALWQPGQTLDVVNTTANAMTLVNEDTSSTSTNRITVGAGVSVTLPPYSSTRFVYDGPTSRFVVQNVGLARPTCVNVKDYGALGNGTTDDTTAIRAAITAWQALVLAGGSLELFFPAGIYVISGQLTITGISGGRICGAGINQTILQDPGTVSSGGGAVLGYLTLTNCQYTTISDLSISPGTYAALLSGSVSSSATSATVASWYGNSPVVGQRIAFISKAVSPQYSVGEEVVIQSVSGTSITFSPPLINSYSVSDYVGYGALAGVVFYSDQTLGGAQVSTNNRCEKVFVGKSGGISSLFGFAAACKGGGPVRLTAGSSAGSPTLNVTNAGLMYVGETLQVWNNYASGPQSGGPGETVTVQSISGDAVTLSTNLLYNHTNTAEVFIANANDVNNDGHIFTDCFVENTVLAGFAAEGQNVLGCHAIDCSVGGITFAAFWCAQGGSFDAFGGNFSVAGWNWVIGGMVQHASSQFGGASEGQQGLLYSDNSWGTQNLNWRGVGVDHKFGPPADVFKVYGGNTEIFIQGGLISGPTWVVEENLSGSIGPSLVTISGAEITATAMTLANVSLIEAGAFYPSSAPTMTLSGGSTVSYYGRTVANANHVSSFDQPLALTTQTTATTATGGSGTLPSAPVGFIEITINGTAAKIPYYAT
jgi:hypothetical protein